VTPLAACGGLSNARDVTRCTLDLSVPPERAGLGIRLEAVESASGRIERFVPCLALRETSGSAWAEGGTCSASSILARGSYLLPPIRLAQASLDISSGCPYVLFHPSTPTRVIGSVRDTVHRLLTAPPSQPSAPLTSVHRTDGRGPWDRSAAVQPRGLALRRIEPRFSHRPEAWG